MYIPPRFEKDDLIRAIKPLENGMRQIFTVWSHKNKRGLYVKLFSRGGAIIKVDEKNFEMVPFERKVIFEKAIFPKLNKLKF